MATLAELEGIRKTKPIWTNNMRRALKFILEFILKHKKSPTTVEIANGLGYNREFQARSVISRLVARGVLDKLYGKHRGLRVIDISKIPDDLYSNLTED